MENMKLFYLHIPKTGGQTLAMRLASAFPIRRSSILSADLVHPRGIEELGGLWANNDFIERHVTGPVLMDVEDVDILTTIREPVAQVVSNFLHIRREPGSSLHRAATTLPARMFFTNFGDFLANHQTRYLVGAFFEVGIWSHPHRRWSELMFDALDRVRWTVPTEHIDEFVTLWSLETKRNVPSRGVSINITRKDENDQHLFDLVRGMPQLYALDVLLWQEARHRFDDYRNKVLGDAVPYNSPDDASRAYWKEGSGIWLRRGWHPPQINTPVGIAWWAGPDQCVEVAFVRQAEERYLKFSVVVVCGVRHSQIVVLGPDREERLPTLVKEVASRWDFFVDLAVYPNRGSIWLWVPEVWSPIMVNETTNDSQRKSFATCSWELLASIE